MQPVRDARGPSRGLRLGTATLDEVGARVSVPIYDRAALGCGIVHFGVGGFHRAHQAAFVDQLLNQGAAAEWGICGVGVMAPDQAMQQALRSQDYLYTLVQKHGDGHYDARVIGSIVDYVYAPDDADGVVRRIADPATQLVTLTITEGGYGINDLTGEFDPDTPWIAADLQSADRPPGSVFGLITAGLERRRREGAGPITVVSCDNLPGNGSLARKGLTAFAHLRDRNLAGWIEDTVSFPNSMVDRITPVTTDEDREQVRSRFGIEDQWPVVCEPFVQWVLEDSFVSRRPALEQADGVQLVADVAPYELMKLRLLNAGHQGLCYFARLCGYTYVHEAAQDPLFREFLADYMDEASSTLEPVPGIDLTAYKLTLIERFSNPEIRDTVARLCAESSDRIPKFVLPVIRAQLDRGGSVTRAAAIVASWARYAEGTDEQAQPIEIVDRRRDELVALAARQHDDPLVFLSNRELFGDLKTNAQFTAAYASAMNWLHERGARQTLEFINDLPSPY
jgi:mannitol 2-dehydrogenase